MKLINPKYEIIEQEPGLSGIYKAIELAGRTCYKSEDKITDTSAKEFVDRMIKSGHHSMLEFGTVYLSYESCRGEDDSEPIFDNVLDHYENNKYSKYTLTNPEYYMIKSYVTTNYRVLVENGWLDDLKYLCEPTEYHEKRVYVRFTTDRGVSHELVRHRVFSFAQESTRYCNYSKDKFSNELTFIIPSWCTLGEGKYSWQGFNYGNEDYWCGWRKDSEPLNTEQSSDLGKTIIERMINYHALLRSLNSSEENYKELLSKHTPQEARQVLPNALKTEINMCGFVSDWKRFFTLRDNPHVHPDMQALVKPLHKEFVDNGTIDKRQPNV